MKNEYIVSYENYCKCNFKNDVKEAVKFYLTMDNFGGFILYPHALNPFLKIMETMGESPNIIILPTKNIDEINFSPAYIILKIGIEASRIYSIITINAASCTLYEIGVTK